MEPFPDAGLLPVTQAPPTGRAAPAAEFRGQHLPGNPALEDEDDAGQGGAVGDTGSSPLGFGWLLRQERLDGLPEVVGDQGVVLHRPDDATPAGY